MYDTFNNPGNRRRGGPGHTHAHHEHPGHEHPGHEHPGHEHPGRERSGRGRSGGWDDGFGRGRGRRGGPWGQPDAWQVDPERQSLRQSVGTFVSAVAQVRGASPALRDQVRTIVDQARRDIYRLLSEEPTPGDAQPTPGDAVSPTSDTE